MNQDERSAIYFFLPILFLVGRIFLFLGMVPDAFYWAGDMVFYYQVTNLTGWPFINHWIEYPPLFPFICEVFNIVSSNGQFLFTFFITILLAAAGAGSIWLFGKIAQTLTHPGEALLRTIIYFGLLSVIPYTWWYYDPLVVFFILAANWAFLQKKHNLTGLWIGLGILAKWFPIFILPSIWRQQPVRKALRITAIAVGMVIVVWGTLYLISPEMTRASLIVQPGRSSWQTIWAMIDNNKTLGSLVEFEARYDPVRAGIKRGNDAVIPTWITLLIFGNIGFYLLVKARPDGNKNLLAIQGFTWLLFFIWSPGWSPQWILYLLPIILLTLPPKEGFMYCLAITLLTLIEYPLLLGRHLFDTIWVLAPLRMAIFGLLTIQWVKISHQPELMPARPT